MTNQLEIPLTDEQLPPEDASWKEILEETDWDLLRKQKEQLNEILMEYNKEKIMKRGSEKNINRFSAIEGILEFLHHIQDAAANEIGEETVFDYESNDDDDGD